MTALSPQPYEDTDCHGQRDAEERLALAVTLCNARGARLTKMRLLILEMLWQERRPTGAYELVEALNEQRADPVGPPTVYRALEFLMKQGLVTKIESRNAYIPCAHPERSHICLFFLCDSCGSSDEVEDRKLERLIAENAVRLGFQANRRVLEVEGTCKRCLAEGDSEP